MRVNYAASEGCLNFFIPVYMVAYKALLKAQSNMQEILHNIDVVGGPCSISLLVK